MRNLNLSPKTLVVLDNALEHPDMKDLTAEDNKIQAIFCRLSVFHLFS